METMMKESSMVKRTSWLFLFLVCLYIAVFFIVSFRLYERIGVFGCGDECINYTAGYFLLLGKSLYSQIFFNHQPGLAYISALIQWSAHPRDLYHLILYHRLFVAMYALAMGLLLLWRFRLSAMLFLLLYEGTKYYMYGYQFIGEAFIVYPLAYLMGLLWESLVSKPISRTDLFFAAFFCSVVVYMREPYIPVVIALFGVLIWRQRMSLHTRWAVLLFVFMILAPFIWIPIREYVNQVVVANFPAARSVVGSGNVVSSFLYAIFYPLILYVHGRWSYVRIIELGVATFFWVGIFSWWRQGKKIFPVLVVFVILALSGLRAVLPGTMYFEAFHMLPWYGLFLMITALLITSVGQKYIQTVLAGAFIVFALWAFASAQSFIWERVNRHAEFESQYAKYTQYSQAIQIVSEPTHTLFLDMWDDIIYWEAKRDSSYPLSIYIPMESMIARYQDMRLAMFAHTPPDIYYSCPQLQSPYNSLPDTILHDYVQLHSLGSPSCLYVKVSIAQTLTQDTWRRLGQYGFFRP